MGLLEGIYSGHPNDNGDCKGYNEHHRGLELKATPSYACCNRGLNNHRLDVSLGYPEYFCIRRSRTTTLVII